MREVADAADDVFVAFHAEGEDRHEAEREPRVALDDSCGEIALRVERICQFDMDLDLTPAGDDDSFGSWRLRVGFGRGGHDIEVLSS